MPEDFDNGGGGPSNNGRARVTRQQQEELRSLLEHHHLQELEREQSRSQSQSQSTPSGMASSSFRNDIYRKKIDMASVAPQYFSPDPLESIGNSNDNTNTNSNTNTNTNTNSNQRDNGNGYKNFLQVPQLNLPTRIAQPGLGFELHNRALKSLVHERFGRNPQRPENNNDYDNDSSNDNTLNDRDPKSHLVSRKPEWKRLEEHVADINKSHLRELLQDEERAQSMFAEHDGIYLDYSRQRATSETMGLLHDLAKTQRL